MGYIDSNACDLSTPITSFTVSNIANKGMNIQFKIMHEHRILLDHVTCPDLVRIKTKNPLDCPIHGSMMLSEAYTQQNLDHLRWYSHINCTTCPKCKCDDGCEAYIRLEAYGNK